MNLGDFVNLYRTERKISMQDFANKCGLSKSYISMLEKSVNPRNNKPIVPTIDTYNKIAHGMNLELDELLKAIDSNEPVCLLPSSFNSDTINSDEHELLDKYHQLNNDGKSRLIERADELIDLGYVIKGDALNQA